MACFRGIRLPFIMLLIIGTVNGRWLELEPYLVTSSVSITSDGIDDMNYIVNPGANLADEKRCHSIYGFLPCADTMQEGVFLMIMYTYLMMLGEECIHEGSEALFMLLGDKEIGASVFRVLMALPRIIIVIVSGVLSTTLDAQNQVTFGVSMYAGSTVITLTLIWGFRVILTRHKLREKGSTSEYQHQEHPSSTSFFLKHKLSTLKDIGVNVDKETRNIAMIMLLSLIPFATVELVALFKSRIAILLALIVSGGSLILYFVYQIGNPWIRVKSLAYLKQENLINQFLYHVKRLAKDDLIDEQGNPNSEAFKRIFDEADEDKDGWIAQNELERLIVNEFKLEKGHISKEYATTEILKHFDMDKSGKINFLEFEKGCIKWLKNVVNSSSSSSHSKNIWKQIKKSAIEKKRASLTKIEQIMPRILQQVLEKHKLVTGDGEPNREKIEELFSQYGGDTDNGIHQEALKKCIQTLQFGVSLDHDRVIDELVKDFDTDSSRTINKNEFVEGFVKWIKKAINHDSNIKDSTRAIAKFEENSWKEIDATMNSMVKSRAKILYVVFGVGITYLISGAFMQSVIQFSDAARIPFLLTSFVMAPLAMNARSIIKAFFSAQLDEPHAMKNASVVFSEIYNGLVMNNLLGLSTLLTIVCVKGLTWSYSNEVLTIMLPCTILGLFVFKRDTYPLWASISAMLLYPISICLYYFLYN